MTHMPFHLFLSSKKTGRFSSQEEVKLLTTKKDDLFGSMMPLLSEMGGGLFPLTLTRFYRHSIFCGGEHLEKIGAYIKHRTL